MKWADIDPDPGVDTRDYAAEGRNNAIGLAGYVGGTLTAIPSAVEAAWNVPNVLRNRPWQTIPGSFNWAGEKTGLRGHPLYEIGGIGYAGVANTAWRQGIARPVQQMARAEDMRRIERIGNRLREHPAFDPEDFSEFGDMVHETLINRWVKQDPYLRARAAAEEFGDLARKKGGYSAPVAGPADTAIQYGIGAERAHRNIKEQQPFPNYRRNPLQQK